MCRVRSPARRRQSSSAPGCALKSCLTARATYRRSLSKLPSLRSLNRIPRRPRKACSTSSCPSSSTRDRRTVAAVTTLLEQRERMFTDQGIDSIASYRRMRASGEVTGDGFGDVCLVVDGWLTLRHEYETLEAAITTLAAR